jgi:mono/diheme cytochrome c family protein
MRCLTGIRLICAALLSAGVWAQNAPDSIEFFETRIRPLLANNCFGCHTSSAMGGLRLDSRDALLKGGKRGTALLPGDAEKSLLMVAVRHQDESMKMPMGNKLKDAQIQDLAAWVKAGAVWPKSAAAPAVSKNDGKYVILPEMRKFWSLVPLKESPAPAVRDARWAKTNIDRFVLAKLESEGIRPVALAGKRDLIRRATLDLTGLPATFEDIQAFEKDNTPDAFGKVIDRLLASPHYGERWGRHWLDVARYGEDDYRSLNPFPRGFRPYPNAFTYRDWVINAVNDDLPYNEFVKAQLAGDLVEPKLRQKYLPATGFLGLGPWYYDNGAFEITRADERHDRVDVITRGFLGMTAGCARCHDHKYDPIPQSDYYSLAGVFQNTIYEEYPLAPKKVVDEHAKLEHDLDRAEMILEEARRELSETVARALAYQASSYLQAVWEINGPLKKKIEEVVEDRKLDYELTDRWVKYMERSTKKYPFKDAFQELLKKADSKMPEAKKLADQLQEKIVAVMLEHKELEEENKVIVAKDLDGTRPKKRTDKPSNFVSFKDFNPGSWLRLKALPEEESNFYTEIFERELTENDDPNAMMMFGGRRNFRPGVLLFRGWGLETRVGSEAQARLKSLESGTDALRKKVDAKYPFLHGVRDAEKPVDIQLSHRGDPNNPTGPPVPRHFLSVFSEGEPKKFAQGSGRLELAEAIVQQPVAMRVFVNRVWKSHFGTGLVDTPSNFGNTGERPTNPELLEYLALSFQRNGYSLKKLHREIMLSSVYQLSTQNDTAAAAKDSGNRFYWRANRKRMDAEQIRDGVLFASGKLDTALGGPSTDLSPVNLRRTVYGKVSRYKPDEYLMLWDFPSPLISAEKRFATTVPTQRLFLMNSDFMQLQAEEVAKRVAGEANNTERIRKAYRIVYGREATAQEVALGLEYLKAEPLAEYDEQQKKKEAKPEKEGKPLVSQAGAAMASKPEAAEDALMTAADAADPNAGMGMGMMAGMGRRRMMPGPTPPPKYEATVWGRYAKVLLSSSEFLFVN